MTDQVSRRIPTAASTAAMQSDQRCSHVISSCFNIMDQSDIEAAMKKSESDTELLTGNVMDYSSNTLTRSKKVSNLEKTEDEVNVRIQEKPGRNQTIASKHINRAFDFLKDYAVESAEVDITRIPENPSEEDCLTFSPDKNKNLDNSNKKNLIGENYNSSSVPSEVCVNKKSQNSLNGLSDCKTRALENNELSSEYEINNCHEKDTKHELCINMNHPQNEKYADVKSESECVTVEKLKNDNTYAKNNLTQIDLQNNDILKAPTNCLEKENINKNSIKPSADLVKDSTEKVENSEIKTENIPSMNNEMSIAKECLKQSYVQSDATNCKDSSSGSIRKIEKRSNSEVSAEDMTDGTNLATVANEAPCSVTEGSIKHNDNESYAEDLNLKPLPTSLSDPSVPSLLKEEPKSNYLIQGGMSLRRGGRRANRHLMNGRGTVDYSDEESSDEDSGIYAESTRNSCWICVTDEGTPSRRTASPAKRLPSICDVEGVEEEKTKDSSSTKPEDNDVFSDNKINDKVPSNHKRTESNATTASENSFRRQFLHRNKKVVLRKDSQTEYQRFSAKFLECEEVMNLTKEHDDEFGLHILDSHPTIVTSVDPGSPAEKAGIKMGHILVSVNNVNVLESSHEEIIRLIQQSKNSVSLSVGLSNVCYSRDLEAPVMTGYMLKLGNSHLPLLKRAAWRKRWFVLRKDNCMYYYKSEKEDTPLGAFPLANYCISRYLDTNKDYCFKAEKYGSRTYYFMTESREDMNRWVEALQIAAHSSHRKDSWLDVTSHNVGIPALEIKRPDCSGYLYKMGLNRKVWRRRYCILKDACVYYYKNIESISAKGVAHFHGYEVDENALPEKKYGFVVNPPEKSLRTFYFNAENETDKKRWVEALKTSIGRWIRVL